MSVEPVIISDYFSTKKNSSFQFYELATGSETGRVLPYHGTEGECVLRDIYKIWLRARNLI